MDRTCFDRASSRILRVPSTAVAIVSTGFVTMSFELVTAAPCKI